MENETTDISRFLDEKGKIKSWPSKFIYKKAIVEYLSTKFESNVFYTEKEVNQIISNWHNFDDFFLLRRSLIDYGFMSREKDGSKYWKK